MEAFDFSKIYFNAGLLVKEMQVRGIHVKLLEETSIVKASYKKHAELLYDVFSSLIPFPIGWIIDDKVYSKQFLHEKGFRVPQGKVFAIDTLEDAVAYAQEIGFPVVVKPTSGSHGDNVYVDVENENELRSICERFEREGINFLIEEQVVGNEYRLFATKDGFFAAVARTPSKVVGDGKRNIMLLIKNENDRRMNPRVNCLCRIRLDSITFDYMEKHNITVDYIPAAGEEVYLRRNSNVSTGGNCFDVTDQAHHTIKELAFHILDALAPAPLIGIDLLCQDIGKDISYGYSICELNSAPGLSLHMMPEKGIPRNVAGAIVDLLFPETKKK